MFKISNAACAAVLAACAAVSTAEAAPFKVTITNNANPGGTYLTPVWVGFHDGAFDLFNPGGTASAGLELVAEVGQTVRSAASLPVPA